MSAWGNPTFHGGFYQAVKQSRLCCRKFCCADETTRYGTERIRQKLLVAGLGCGRILFFPRDLGLAAGIKIGLVPKKRAAAPRRGRIVQYLGPLVSGCCCWRFDRSKQNRFPPAMFQPGFLQPALSMTLCRSTSRLVKAGS